jgi:hypothetical protein
MRNLNRSHEPDQTERCHVTKVDVDEVMPAAERKFGIRTLRRNETLESAAWGSTSTW